MRVLVNGNKGVWTLDEVVSLLGECGVKVKVSFSLKEAFKLEENGGSHEVSGDDLHSGKEVE